jgi:hypothetical protein
MSVVELTVDSIEHENQSYFKRLLISSKDVFVQSARQNSVTVFKS